MKILTFEELEQRMPQTIDDVIPSRDLMTLRLATVEDLAELPPGVAQEAQPKMRLRDWYVISIYNSLDGNRLSWSLFGTHAKRGGTWCTSNLIAREGARFLTHSGSIYEVVGEPSDKPDLPFVCGWLNYLGVGEALGVLPIIL